MADSHYGFGARLLHRCALSSDALAEVAFDLEKTLYGRSCPEDNGRHVFVAGLARAGTTLLMRLIYESGDFCSLTYRDMPFVMAPNLWAGLTSRSKRHTEAQQRAHGDGLLVDFDSPEALEEIFWRVHGGSDYLHADHLAPMVANEATVRQFRQYVALVLRRYGGRRYLSKNNNNILRISSLSAAYPQSLILIPFRHPLAQAASLMRQHQRFQLKQAAEPFVRTYMDWLVHHEFGSGHRPFSWTGANTNPWEPDNINYWLSLWLRVYSQLLTLACAAPQHRLLVSYDALCASPVERWAALARRLDVSTELPQALVLEPGQATSVSAAVDASLLADAEALYRQLHKSASS